MSDSEGRMARISELQRTIVFAHGLGVRAEVCGDEEQKREAARIYAEAKAELDSLTNEPDADAAKVSAQHGASDNSEQDQQ